MAEIKEFVVNDRRKFTAEGDARPDAPPSEPKPPRPETLQPAAPPADEFNSSARLTTNEAPKGPQAVPSPAQSETSAALDGAEVEPELPPAPTTEQNDAAKRAFDATVERLDTAIRATNPGIEHQPEMNFERVIQSLYMQAILQLGGGAPSGQQPQVDLLGARQTIDMLAILDAKTEGNLEPAEKTLLETALFEARMGFLEVTQAMARQAAQRQPGAAPAGFPPPPGGGPSIVR
jgi:hypothetical protein